MEISLFHNIIITGSCESKIYIYDYEYGKLIACLSIERGTEPTGFSVINGYRLLLIATNSGILHILRFFIKDFKAHFELFGSFSLSSISEFT